jgi:hypothetical protein
MSGGTACEQTRESEPGGLTCRFDGEQHATMSVSALPPKLSISSLVSLESL